MSEPATTTGENRAVSPVIGVILMVAITVILAAVIGAFVLEIGDQQETAPSTSFDTEQETVVYKRVQGGNQWLKNWTTVSISHAGGSTVDLAQLEVKHDGNASTYRAHNPNNGKAKIRGSKPNCGYSTLQPGEVCDLESGQSLEVVASGVNHEHLIPQSGTGNTVHFTLWHGDEDRDIRFDNDDFQGSGSEKLWPYNNENGEEKLLNQGENINVVWTATSGGKTQTLFKYTVQ